MNQRISLRRTRRRSAFTLLELVIATSLVVTMLLIVWSLFSIYTKLEEKGNQSANETQLARSLFVQFRRDLQRLTTSPDHATSFSSVSSSGAQVTTDGGGTMSIETDLGLSNQPTAAERIIGDRQRPAALPRVGFLRGDSRSLTMIVRYEKSTDRETSDEASLIPPGPASADFVGTVEPNDEDQFSNPQSVWQVITYDFRAPFSARGSTIDGTRNIEANFGEAETLQIGGDSGEDDGLKSRLAVGLTRRTQLWSEWVKERRDSKVDWPGGESLSLTGDTPGFGDRGDLDDVALFENGVDEIPEVTNLRLRYFDGRVWASAWDSDSRDGIPVAVEVFFELDGSRQWPRESESEEQESADDLEEFPSGDDTVGTDAEFTDRSGATPGDTIRGESELAMTPSSVGSATTDDMELIGYRFVILLRQSPYWATQGDTP